MTFFNIVFFLTIWSTVGVILTMLLAPTKMWTMLLVCGPLGYIFLTYVSIYDMVRAPSPKALMADIANNKPSRINLNF
jgi:hypothetical protein